jgi:hypothetical protein
MSRTQITLDPETRRPARQRASDLGLSLAEYVRRLVARDLRERPLAVNSVAAFDLGASVGSDIATNKDTTLAEAFASVRRKARESARS